MGDGWCLNCFVHVADIDRHMKIDCPYVTSSAVREPDIPLRPEETSEQPATKPIVESSSSAPSGFGDGQPAAARSISSPIMSNTQPSADPAELELVALPPPPRASSAAVLSATKACEPAPAPAASTSTSTVTPPSSRIEDEEQDSRMNFDEPIPDHLGFENLKLLLEEDNKLLTLLLEWTDAERFVVTRKIRWDLPFAAHALYASATFQNQRLRIQLLRPKRSGSCPWRQLVIPSFTLNGSPTGGDRLRPVVSKQDTHYVCTIEPTQFSEQVGVFLEAARLLCFAYSHDGGARQCEFLQLPEDVAADSIFLLSPGSIAIYTPLRPAPEINILNLK